MAGKFDSIEQLFNDLSVEWHEYEFIYKGKEYGLNPWSQDNKISFLVELPDDTYLEFYSFDELLDGFIVDGKSFREFMFDVDVDMEF